MDNSNDKNEKTLTIGMSQLKLNRPLDTSQIRQSIRGKSNKVTVVKKKRIFSREEENYQDSSELVKENTPKKESVVSSTAAQQPTGAMNLTEKERNVRLNALKNAAENSKVFESKNLVKETKEVTSEEINVVEESEPNSPPAVNEIIAEKHEDHHHKPKVKLDSNEEDEEDDEFKKAKSKVKADVKGNKSKFDNNRRNSGKINLNRLIDSDEDLERTRSLASIKRAREKARRAENDRARIDSEKIIREVIVPEIITVQELANRMSVRSNDLIKELMKLGMMVTASQEIDVDTAEIVVEAFGHKIKKVAESDIEKSLSFENKDPAKLVKRAPVVTVMGHVDHGKTSLLDALKETDVVSSEAGGITQHIGAYRIKLASGESITFIDTPGHEAFTAMRARGAQSTDIVVLVVAADDGIMEQTKEAINHAKAAEVPIIVAVNKIDKPEANSQKVRNELLNYSLVPEEFGGDIMVIDVSAKAKLNLDKLEEAILLQAEMLDLKANPQQPAAGVVIESKMDKNKGIVTTLLVQRGTLKVGDIVVAGTGFGKVKMIFDDKGVVLKDATPSMPVEVLGLNTSPEAGEKFAIVETEKQARDIVEYRERKAKIHKISTTKKGSLEELFAQAGAKQKITELSVIIKGDVQGSVEAIIGSLNKFSSDEIKIKILHTGVGGITQSDVVLANASRAIIVGFNVRADVQARQAAESLEVDIRYYSIIYNLVDDIKAVLGGMLSPIIKEVYIGTVKIKQVFNISKTGKIAGCTVIDGVIKQFSNVRLLRDNIVIYQGKIKTLKRYKDEAKEVKEGQECGIALENYDDIKENDMVEVFEEIHEQRQLQ